MRRKTAYKTVFIASVMAAAALLALGCGSSEDNLVSAPVTRAQFVKKAEKICTRTRDEREVAVAEWEKQNGKKLTFDVLLKQIAGPLLEEEAQQLRSLDAPAGEKAKLAPMVENLARGAAAYTTEGTALKSAAAIEKFEKEAAAYGIGACRL